MTKGRIEAFSDGVLAIILTIMVLELKVPHGHDLAALLPLWPVVLSYVLSFLYVGMYWNNHHHMFQAVHHIGGWVLWANLHLLFWLSLLPFSTGFMGENSFAGVPMLVYSFNLMMCGLAYTGLTTALIGQHGRDSDFARALGADRKGKISLALYLMAIVVALVLPLVAFGLLVTVALIWVVPDRRFQKPSSHAR
ncbi:MAG: TMEM175 family protein [Rhodobacteraceae bacterium]|nr:TMEM175 family protein [Paracoccaceae bacterium]